MENLNVIKKSLASLVVSTNKDSEVVDSTFCGTLAFQVAITSASGIADASVQVYKSLDNATWEADSDAVTISGNGSLYLSVTSPLDANFYKLAFLRSAGSYNAAILVLGKTIGLGGGSGSGGGVTSVGATSPIASSGGSTPNISLSGVVSVAKGGTNSSTALSNNRVIKSASGAIVEADAITANRALISDANGIPVHATTTATEIGYVSGVSSAIQTQLGTKAPTASPAFTTQVTFGNYHLEPSEVDDGNSGTADTIDWSAGSAHKSTLTGNVTYTFSNPVTGGSYVLRVLTGAGSFAVTWPGTVKWPGGVAPTITVTAARMDLFNFYWDGTNYYGSFAQNYTP